MMDDINEIISLAERFQQAKLMGTSPMVADGSRSPLKPLENTRSVKPSTSRPPTTASKSSTGPVSAYKSSGLYQTPAVGKSSSPSPASGTVERPVVGRLLFENTAERKLVPVNKAASTIKKRPKRKLEQVFHGPSPTSLPKGPKRTALPPLSAPGKSERAPVNQIKSLQEAMAAINSPVYCLDELKSLEKRVVISSPLYSRPSSSTSSAGAGIEYTMQQVQADEQQENMLPLVIPTVDNPTCGCPSITPQTLTCLLSSMGVATAANVVLIDCRYSYEYQGGHVTGAQHLPTPLDLQHFFDTAPYDWSRTVIVFYCEFSSERAPRAFRHVRQQDRRKHFEKMQLDALSYPHMYVLQGGYSSFVEENPEYCTGSYVSMHSAQHHTELQASHTRIQTAWAAVNPIGKYNPHVRSRLHVEEVTDVMSP